jgi:endonuclease-8
MPEGPSLVILKDEVQQFKGKKILSVGGNTKIPVTHFARKKVIDFKTWGKHFLICFSKQTIRIHFLLFGSYRVNETKETPPRLSLTFSNGVLNFYACSIRLIDEPLDEVYDWTADVMNDAWDQKKANRKLQKLPQTIVGDALLDQNIFAGVGNIIRNEVLFRIKVHPESLLGKMPKKKLNELIREARKYCFQFLEWKKAFVLKKHWLAHTKKTCPRCSLPLVKAYPGRTKRRSFFCNNCQVLFV